MVSFSNSALRLPFHKVEYAPRWTVTALAEIGEGQRTIEASIVGYALDEETPMGWVDRTEAGLAAEFMVGVEHAEMIQALALSPIPFIIQIEFSADQTGAVRSLKLSVNREQQT
ncbi:hypothetical protein MBEBAB_0272 [Brevundimonas abyssalis TAR-001]|jgi:hypothetical protein|uniref:Uncharacterized protein n=2 Tax=Caulobacteraceae TaxID=76892 RepID=A0A8E0KKB8_9CAUL|nr:hypothetical protein MBEBAB_0272 [Brevundimonas abyssalis TAR-001]